MTALLLLVLAQPTSLNLNGQPLTALRCDGGVTCARSGTVAYVYGSGAAASSGPPIDGGFVLWGGSVGSSNERTLTSSATATVNTGTAGQVKLDVVTPVASASALAADPTSCSGGQYVSDVAANGALTCSTPPGTYVLPDATAAVTGGVRLTGDLGGTATSPSVVDDSHAHTGTTISSLDTGDLTSGTLGVGRGGTGVSTVASNQVYVGTAADTLTAKTLPSCSNGTTSKLLYDNATQTFSCGTDQTGGGGGVSPLFVAQGSP